MPYDKAVIISINSLVNKTKPQLLLWLKIYFALVINIVLI